ncbi:MAG: tRNA modification GTPase [uncultured bacterium]|nr:MAG: tRNA modification GTPase [uncultured bacterium]
MHPIIAVSTPGGTGAIGIIRLSGEGCISLVSKYFIPFGKKEPIKHRYAYFGALGDENIVFDQVIITAFYGPSSYTGEDVVEISCHGNRIILEKIINHFLINGVKPAEPGEFTRRSFLNGKMDLIQAESVEDIIMAENDNALKAAQKLITGKLTDLINTLKKKLISIISEFEAEIEFPDEGDIIDSLNVNAKLRMERITDIRKIVQKLINSFDQGVILKEGFKVALFGSPNTGKSTLLNYLAGYERALVSAEPGTTRDYITEKIYIHGMPLTFIDMAGIRENPGKIEFEGIKHSKEILHTSNIGVFIIDGTKDISKDDYLALESCPKSIDKIFVINKSDCNTKVDLNDSIFQDMKPLFISAKNGDGIEELLTRISKILSSLIKNSGDEIIITHIRHNNALTRCDKILNDSISEIENRVNTELLVYTLREALNELQILTGEVSTDDILNEIFCNFCIGK